MANLKGKGQVKESGKSATRVISRGGGVTLRARKTKTGESLYLDYMVNGKRKPEFLELYLSPVKTPMDKNHNTEVLIQAEKLRAQRSIDLPSLKHDFIPTYKMKMDFLEWVWKFIQGKNNHFHSAYLKLKEFADGGTIRFSDINEEWLEEYKSFLLKNMKAVNSAACYYDDIVGAIKAAKKAKLIKESPSDNVDRISNVRTLIDFHTPEEVKIMFNTPCKHDLMKRAYLFGCLTGLRSIDLFAIKRNRFEKYQSPDGEIEYRIKLVQQKVTDTLYLTISEEAWLLAGEPQTDDPEERVFPLEYTTTLRDKLRRWVKNFAKINKNVGWHTARHTNAVIMLMNGIDIYTVSKRLGHQHITTTQRYCHIVDSQMNKAANIKLFTPVQLKKQEARLIQMCNLPALSGLKPMVA